MADFMGAKKKFLAGFMLLGERLRPDEIKALVGEFVTRMSRAVEEFGGSVAEGGNPYAVAPLAGRSGRTLAVFGLQRLVDGEPRLGPLGGGRRGSHLRGLLLRGGLRGRSSPRAFRRWRRRDRSGAH